MKREEIVKFAKTMVGLPYRHMGRNGINSKKSGLDCAGLFVCICEHFEIPYRDIIGTYSEYPSGGQIERMFSRSLIPLEKGDIKLACVVLMHQIKQCKSGSAQPQHAILVSQVSPLRIIHAFDSPSFRKVVESPIPHGYADRITHVFDFPGVED